MFCCGYNFRTPLKQAVIQRFQDEQAWVEAEIMLPKTGKLQLELFWWVVGHVSRHHTLT